MTPSKSNPTALDAPEDVLSAIDAQRRPRPALDAPFAAPRDIVEEATAEIWAEILHIDRIGIADNFFALGGNSLHMALVASRIRSQFGIEIPFGHFFQDPTLAGVAGLVRDA